MKKKLYPLAIAVISLLFMASCESESPMENGGNNGGETGTTTNEKINQWIYSEMADNYLWEVPNVDQKQNPETYFKTILNKEDKYTINGQTYSYSEIRAKSTSPITQSFDPGFEYAINYYSGDEKIYYVIYYVKKGSDAERKGLKRGYLIAEINGTSPSTIQEADKLMKDAYTNGQPMLITAAIPGGKNTLDFSILPQNISSKEAAVYAVNDTIIDGKKIGYMLYNRFDEDSETDLLNQLQDLYSKGVEHMVLDLRYNARGSFNNAQVLGSALVKNRTANTPFIIYKRRPSLNNDRVLTLLDQNKNNIEIPRLGDKLKKLYVITGQNTSGASDPFINALKAYWGNDLILVGQKTLGLGRVAVQTMEDENYTIFIASAIMADKEGNANYQGGFTPAANNLISEVNEDNVSTILGAFGTKEEAVYAKVLSLITGRIVKTRTMPISDNGKLLKSSILDKPLAGKTIWNEVK